MATCVFTCRSWFSMSRITCLIIFSGSSARSIKSLRFARTSVATRSSTAMSHPRRLAVANLAHTREQIRHRHARERLDEGRHLRGDFGQVVGYLVHSRRAVAAGGDDGDLV